MKALYALPDHEVVMELIPRIADTHLSADAAVERIRAVNGLVPVAIDPESETGGGGKVLWADIGDHLFQEWQFMYTVQTLAQSSLGMPLRIPELMTPARTVGMTPATVGTSKSWSMGVFS